jgi:lipopolysaccharide biosynthesis glycosyltransferase
LKKLGISSDVDIVALHCKVSRHILNAMHKLGILTVPAYPPLRATSRGFRNSLLKLRIFQLTQYERIVFLDADALPLTNLDLLFKMKFNDLIAMPRAYWLPHLWGTSVLILASPSVESWERLLSWLGDEVAHGHDVPPDMDAFNLVFSSQIQYLPAEYMLLNGDWSDRNFVPVYGDPEVGLERAQVIHFTDLGKPWAFYPQMVRRLRPNARRRYYEFWDTWWTLRDELWQASPALNRFAYALLKHQAVFENSFRQPLERAAVTMLRKCSIKN